MRERGKKKFFAIPRFRTAKIPLKKLSSIYYVTAPKKNADATSQTTAHPITPPPNEINLLYHYYTHCHMPETQQRHHPHP